MSPKFLFTLDGDLGSKVISEPEGWATIIFNLERDLTYWSLIENFELPLIFYGVAESQDGGYDYLKSAINNGIDTLVTIDIQVSFDDGMSYDTCFDGRIDLSTAQETIFRSKIQAAIVRNDLWAQFMANKSKPVDLFSNTDIYGNGRNIIPRQELNAVSQKLKSSYSGIYSLTGQADYLYNFLTDGVDHGIIDFDQTTLSEIPDKYELPIGSAVNVNDSFLFELEYGGDYNFNIQIVAQSYPFGGPLVGSYFDVILKAGSTTVTLSKTTVGSATKYTYTGTITLSASNLIQLYFFATAPGTRIDVAVYGQYAGFPWHSYMDITADTTYTDTTIETVLVHDAGLSICDRILGNDNTFYSEYLGGLNSAIIYSENGCGYLNALTRGLNIRGYSFSEKPFTINFDDYWAGINPIFALGLGYDNSKIRVENKAYFFTPTPSIYLIGVNDITTEFDTDLFTKTIKIGFETWQSETISGIDDPQTKHTYNLRYQLFGKDESQLSKFIAASLAIEQTRRLTKVQTQDWRLDENIFIIALSEEDSSVIPQTSPPTITQQPELFVSGITGLTNSDTRYNVRHTPARMLDRWADFYSGQMQSYTSDSFKYASGEGNVLMSWVGDGGCDSGTLTENQNIPISSNYLFLPIIYSFTHPLTWGDYKSIRDNRNKAISISWELLGVTYMRLAFIKKLGYNINTSKGTFEVWVKNDRGESFDNADFESGSLSPWYSIADGGILFWSINTISSDKTAKILFSGTVFGGTSRTTIALRHTFLQNVQQVRTITYSIYSGTASTSAGSWSGATVYAIYYLNNVEVTSQSIQSLSSGTNYNGTFVTSISNFDAIGIRVIYSFNPSGGSFAGIWQVDIGIFSPNLIP